MSPRRSEPQIALGRTVRAARAERDLTQTDLGVRAGIHPTWISHIERGKINPTWGNLKGICRGLGMTYVEFVERIEQVEALMAESGESEEADR